MFYLLAIKERRVLMESENFTELVDFAQEAKVDGVIAEAALEVRHSGEPKYVIKSSVAEAFERLIEKGQTTKE